MSAGAELQDIRLESEAEPENEVSSVALALPHLHNTVGLLVQASANELGDDEAEGKQKGGLDPNNFSLVEAAQYGNLERWAVIGNGNGACVYNCTGVDIWWRIVERM